jgi:hypothetical protein
VFLVPPGVPLAYLCVSSAALCSLSHWVCRSLSCVYLVLLCVPCPIGCDARFVVCILCCFVFLGPLMFRSLSCVYLVLLCVPCPIGCDARLVVSILCCLSIDVPLA